MPQTAAENTGLWPLKGTGFSPYIQISTKKHWALAPEAIPPSILNIRTEDFTIPNRCAMKNLDAISLSDATVSFSPPTPPQVSHSHPTIPFLRLLFLR